MKRIPNILIIFSIIYLFIFLFPLRVFACNTTIKCEEVTSSALGSCNNDEVIIISSKCNDALSNIEKAAQPHRDELDKMNKAIAAFQVRIAQIEVDVARKTAEIASREQELEGSLALADRRIRQFYIRTSTSNPFYLLLASGNIGSALRTIGYQQAAVNEDKRTITQLALVVKDLEDRKKALESEEATLAALKSDTDKRAESIRKLLAQVDVYEGQIRSAMAAITARQQEFLAEKLAGLGISRSAMSAGSCIDDRPVDPGFSPRFAFFTFGVPNRIGLNQWGAKGRAEAGQSPRDILAAYYNADYTEHYNTGITIHVVGTNEYGQSFNDTWNIEEYLKHLYEMPTNWDSKALQAQAIAARSYALAYTNNGSGTICPSQQCQVVKKENNAQSWIDAVNNTAGIVLTNGGQPIKAWFSSTHGGYVFASGDLQGWSSTSWTKRAVDSSGSINGFGDLFSNAYDRGSPWFYCDWGSRSQYNKTAWLKSDELADVVNVILLARKDSSTRPHLYQTDKSNPEGVETWDASRVRSELGSGALSSVSDVSVDWDRGNGMTTQIHVSGDGGSQSFDGSEFKNFFNLRAPANIQIVGPLFNVEKR